MAFDLDRFRARAEQMQLRTMAQAHGAGWHAGYAKGFAVALKDASLYLHAVREWAPDGARVVMYGSGDLVCMTCLGSGRLVGAAEYRRAKGCAHVNAVRREAEGALRAWAEAQAAPRAEMGRRLTKEG